MIQSGYRILQTGFPRVSAIPGVPWTAAAGNGINPAREQVDFPNSMVAIIGQIQLVSGQSIAPGQGVEHGTVIEVTLYENEASMLGIY